MENKKIKRQSRHTYGNGPYLYRVRQKRRDVSIEPLQIMPALQKVGVLPRIEIGPVSRHTS